MATYTTNLNLKKPAQSDKIRIADINNNMDDIDAAFGAVGTESMAEQLGAIQDSIAIVAIGNAHAAITTGQYVFVKSHETLDTGLYVATSNISENGTLSGSNLTADTAGGLNVLSDRLNKYKGNSSSDETTLTVTPASGVTLNELRAMRIGRIIHISGYATGTFAANTNIVLATVNIKPTYNLRTICGCGAAAYSAKTAGYMIWGASTGDINIELPIAASAVTFDLQYIIN